MSTEIINVEAMPMAVTDQNTLAMQHKSEIEAQVDTAHKYPRSIQAFQADALAMATFDQETAAQMFYRVPRGGKFIEGPSVRLAEVIATAWGNLRYGSRIIEVGPTMLTAQGYFFDSQKNTGAQVEVQRRITNKDGKRFTDDMIVVTGNAASSIALRNAIIKVVPRAYVEQIMKRAQQVAIGGAKTLTERRENAFAMIRKFGLSDERILAAVGKPSIKDLTPDDVDNLAGLYSAVKNDEINIDEAFPEPATGADEDAPKKTSAKGASAKAKEKLGISTTEAPKASHEPPQPVSGPTMEESAFDAEFNSWPDAQQSRYTEAMLAARGEGADEEDAHKAGYAAATSL